MMSKYVAPSTQWAAVRTQFSEMRAPPQNQALSTKRATCQGHWLGSASCPPTILSLAGGPSIPQVAFRSYWLPFLSECFCWNFFAAVLILIMCSSQLSPRAPGAMASLGWYLVGSRAAAGRQCSSGRRLRPLGTAITAETATKQAKKTFIFLDPVEQTEWGHG